MSDQVAAPELGPDPDRAEVDAAVGLALGDDAITVDPLRDADGRLRLSYTRVDTFENCPRRFRYQYVDGLPQAPAPQLSFGSSLHAALEWLYDRKHPVLPTLEETLQALFERWESDGYAEVDRGEQLSAYEHARRILRDLHSRIEKEGFRLPAAVEAWFELSFADDVVVVGAIDRIDAHDDGSLHVIDYKTNRRARTRSQVRGSLQLAIYALATRDLYGRLPETVALDFIVPGVTVTVPVSELDLDAVPARLAAVATRIRSGEDTPTPNRLCDWCDFRAICPAWSGDVHVSADDAVGTEDGGPSTLGRAVQERDRLARSLVRDARRLRQLETAIERLGMQVDGA